MITTLDIVDILWTKINASALKTALGSGGGVYKHQRPLNSAKEDVVINSLPVNNAQLQQAIANVNVYVPDKTINQNGAQSKVPDHVRLDALAAIAVQVLKEEYSADAYHYELQQQSLIPDEASNSHFINIRIEFFNININ